MRKLANFHIFMFCKSTVAAICYIQDKHEQLIRKRSNFFLELEKICLQFYKETYHQFNFNFNQFVFITVSTFLFYFICALHIYVYTYA